MWLTCQGIAAPLETWLLTVLQLAAEEAAALQSEVLAVFEAMPRDLQHAALSSPSRAALLHGLAPSRARVSGHSAPWHSAPELNAGTRPPPAGRIAGTDTGVSCHLALRVQAGDLAV